MQELDMYYESVNQVHNAIREWKKRPPSFRKRLANFFMGFAVFAFVFSLIPILPSLVVFFGSQLNWGIWSFELGNTSIWTYGLAWLLATVVTLVIMFLALWTQKKTESSRKEARAPQSLSPEQLTFIAVYKGYKELKVYFVSHIDRHVENCLQSVISLGGYWPTSVGPGPARARIIEAESFHIQMWGPEASLSEQTSIAQQFLRTFEKYAWFQLDDTLKSRLQALISYQKRIIDRLRNRQDLPAVLSILENLSQFTYAFLPEHQANMDAEALKRLQAEGTKCLDNFVREVNNLTDYPAKVESPSAVGPKQSWSQAVQALYSSNVFVRFALWFILLVALTTSLVFIISLRIGPLDNNIMVSMVIAASVTGAAALAVFTPKSSAVNRELSDHLSNDISKNSERN